MNFSAYVSDFDLIGMKITLKLTHRRTTGLYSLKVKMLSFCGGG